MSDSRTPLGGTCSAQFEPLREMFAAKLEWGEDLGALPDRSIFLISSEFNSKRKESIGTL